MTEQPFEVPVGDGVLAGHRGGGGPPALVLRGGPAMEDYTEGLAAELAGSFATLRYTQRGATTSNVPGPYTIETHSADALAVLNHFGIDRAWAVGHSWGGHLALHLAVAHPDRLLGVIAVDPLGAYGGEVFREMSANLQRNLAPGRQARIDEVEELRRRSLATEDDLYERFTLIWPNYFADPDGVTEPPPGRVGRACSTETNASIAEHFERGTLVEGLPGVRLPVLFVHGELDPLPLWSVERTAELVSDAVLQVIPGCGHFPWWEARGETGRIVGEYLAARE